MYFIEILRNFEGITLVKCISRSNISLKAVQGELELGTNIYTHQPLEYLHTYHAPVLDMAIVLVSIKPALIRKPCSKNPTPPPLALFIAVRGATADFHRSCAEELFDELNALDSNFDSVEKLTSTGLESSNSDFGYLSVKLIERPVGKAGPTSSSFGTWLTKEAAASTY